MWSMFCQNLVFWILISLSIAWIWNIWKRQEENWERRKKRGEERKKGKKRGENKREIKRKRRLIEEREKRFIKR